MLETISTHWAQILAVISVVMGTAAAIHATMTKEEVRSAIGWVGVIVLSPLIGTLIYAVAGINLIRRSTLSMQRAGMSAVERHHLAEYDVPADIVENDFGGAFAAMKILGDRVSRCKLTSGNSIDMLETGDAAYAAMLAAINDAKRSILLETYIFDKDTIGIRFADALVAAVRRGIEVRVLIDAVGARYSIPSIVGYLQKGGVPVDVFNGNIIMGLRLPYANLRTHRKILVIDGGVAFTGGMNIRAGFDSKIVGASAAGDTHFRVTGPIVADLFHTALEDWRFATGELLGGVPWAVVSPEADPGTGVFARVVPSGPDKSLESNHRMMMGAFSVAKDYIRIMSPYFLPDRELISALVTAARRGVAVDILVPGLNNLTLVDHAMTAQFDQILKDGCRIWRAAGHFNHSKLMVIDGAWAYVGSSNLDPRSLRLNFEVDVEVFDRGFAAEVDARILAAMEGAKPVILKELRARPFPRRLLERVIWLGSPYL
ncbi:phosphatidylserine/phosphatidylglycerophosphate/cardiolipin synthase family protein [Phyllobacterium salinisoli]|uniref:Phospholipase D n=1 Tax=Phyllobacterium salinisoli TaxID=1899321 RepID=A0A368K6H2_9HYPH|nr:phosphatidylserine/phosphatidylglycerophosphate/cardiolipin synthase family protein [Phyllobacterium salinisoli]RCS24814.1 phosphatidylserine/phosphatidylglycerophosphate/cardiolipin synthase family protein [Phyllobacterium salinisoli]